MYIITSIFQCFTGGISWSMTSSNGNIFRVAGLLWGESGGPVSAGGGGGGVGGGGGWGWVGVGGGGVGGWGWVGVGVGGGGVGGLMTKMDPGVTRSFDVFFDVHVKILLGKQFRCWWFETHRAHCDLPVMWGFMLCVVILHLHSHCFSDYRDVTWVSWRLKTPATRLFIQQIVRDSIKDNIKCRHYRPFARGILQ